MVLNVFDLPTTPQTDELEDQLRQRGLTLGRAVNEPDVRATSGMTLKIHDDGSLWLHLSVYTVNIALDDWGPGLPPMTEITVPIESIRLVALS